MKEKGGRRKKFRVLVVSDSSFILHPSSFPGVGREGFEPP
jgi:hypothetical protein